MRSWQLPSVSPLKAFCTPQVIANAESALKAAAATAAAERALREAKSVKRRYMAIYRVSNTLEMTIRIYM